MNTADQNIYDDGSLEWSNKHNNVIILSTFILCESKMYLLVLLDK